jgi:hypothetical protein
MLFTSIKKKILSISFLPRTEEERGAKVNHSIFLRFPILYFFLKGRYFSDESWRFQKLLRTDTKRHYKKAVILGNSKDLNNLSFEQFEQLKQQGYLTIGLNRSAYKFQTDILLWSDILTIVDIVKKRAVKTNDCSVIHVRLERDYRVKAKLDESFIALHEYWSANKNFHSWPKEKLFMFRNILVAALHLCYLLNIREVLLIGFGFDNRDYFYPNKKKHKNKGYEIWTSKQINRSLGGYDTQKLVEEVILYLVTEEDFSISFTGDSEFLNALPYISNLTLD